MRPRWPVEPLPRPATLPLALVALALLALHAVCLTQYGWFRDELYYVACSHRMAWGYVDHPPLSIAVVAIVRAVAGESLGALRAVAVLATLAATLVAAGLARDLGGRRGAQVTTAIAVGLAPVTLGTGHVVSMNALDLLAWVTITRHGLRTLALGGTRRWAVLGLLLGLGVMNKWSVLWLAAGLAAALLASPRRGDLRRPGPWLAAALATLVVLPHVLWEVGHGWPTLEFMHNASAQKMRALSLPAFLARLVVVLGPGAAPLWIAGLAVSFSPRRAHARPIGIVFLVTFALLVANGAARAEYLALAAPALVAAGAAWWSVQGRLPRRAVGAAALLLALPLVPLALPLLPVGTYAAVLQSLHVAPHTDERHRMGVLPQHEADMFGWPELADSVARVAATLAPSERARAIVIVDNYGEAGALEHFGRGRVPPVACQHVNYYLWGPPRWDRSVAIVVGRDSTELAREFGSVTPAGRAGHPLAMPYEQDLPIVVARDFRPDLRAAWAAGRHYQ